MRRILAGLILGLLIGAAAATWMLQERANWLAGYAFQLVPPPVPASVLAAIREAEEQYYAGAPLWRRAAEDAQDILAFASPWLTYEADFSLGPYRIKARTIEKILPWAAERGYLQIAAGEQEIARYAIAYFSEQPAISDWQAMILLEWLRTEHPQLRQIAWDALAADPRLVAKLYSGYMGAGGDWALWRASLEPGRVALRRLGLEGG